MVSAAANTAALIQPVNSMSGGLMISLARRRSRRNSLQVRKNATKKNAKIPQVSERRCRMPLQYGIPKISGLKLAKRQTLAQQSPAPRPCQTSDSQSPTMFPHGKRNT